MTKTPNKENNLILTRLSLSDETFMIRDGGNTRLRVLRELWEEKAPEATDG